MPRSMKKYICNALRSVIETISKSSYEMVGEVIYLAVP